MPADLQHLEQRLGHTFRQRDLLVRALTHRSYSFDQKYADPASLPDNEQLEFFGDAILGFLVSECLLQRYPSYPEGRLSKLKHHIVSAVRLKEVAQKIGLGEFLQIGRSEEMSGGRTKKTLLANAMEAVIAALYLDAGIGPVRRFVVDYLLAESSVEAAQRDEQVNYKGALQERVQSMQLPQPQYVSIQETAPGPSQIFTVEARVGKVFASQGVGSSKKAAAQQAAKAVLEQLDSQTPPPNGKGGA